LIGNRTKSSPQKPLRVITPNQDNQSPAKPTNLGISFKPVSPGLNNFNDNPNLRGLISPRLHRRQFSFSQPGQSSKISKNNPKIKRERKIVKIPKTPPSEIKKKPKTPPSEHFTKSNSPFATLKPINPVSGIADSPTVRTRRELIRHQTSDAVITSTRKLKEREKHFESN